MVVLLQVRVLFGFVNGPEFLHVFLNVLLRFVFHILVALQVLRVLAVLQLLVHDAVRQLRGRRGGSRSGGGTALAALPSTFIKAPSGQTAPISLPSLIPKTSPQPQTRYLACQVLEVLRRGYPAHLAVGFAVGVEALHDELGHLRVGRNISAPALRPFPIPRHRARCHGGRFGAGMPQISLRGPVAVPPGGTAPARGSGETHFFPEDFLALLSQLARRVCLGCLGLLGRLERGGEKREIKR